MKNAGRGFLWRFRIQVLVKPGRTRIEYLLLAPRLPDWRGFSTMDLQGERSPERRAGPASRAASREPGLAASRVGPT